MDNLLNAARMFLSFVLFIRCFLCLCFHLDVCSTFAYFKWMLFFKGLCEMVCLQLVFWLEETQNNVHLMF